MHTLPKWFIRHWTRRWVALSSHRGLGRIAARLACWGTAPMHCRAFLAHLHPRGFVAPSASLVHPHVRLGRNTYIGDGVLAFADREAGPIDVQDKAELYGQTLLRAGLGGGITIGSETHVQTNCFFVAAVSSIRIGRNVEIAAGCSFYSFSHGVELGSLIMKQPRYSKGDIVVGDGVWLGHGVTVLDGVRIGDGAVIGAGAVVNKDVPDNAIAVGVPARVLRYREPGESPVAASTTPATENVFTA